MNLLGKPYPGLLPYVGMQWHQVSPYTNRAEWMLTIVKIDDDLVDYVANDGRLWTGMSWKRRFSRDPNLNGAAIDFVEMGGPVK